MTLLVHNLDSGKDELSAALQWLIEAAVDYGYLQSDADLAPDAYRRICNAVNKCRSAASKNSEIVQWAIDQTIRGRKLVALIPPTEAHDGPRYAGYYCEDGPDIERKV